jgi:Ca2+-binding EF-hand superfamily protein
MANCPIFPVEDIGFWDKMKAVGDSPEPKRGCFVVALLGRCSLLLAVVLSAGLAWAQDNRGGDFRSRDDFGGRGNRGDRNRGDRPRRGFGPLTPERIAEIVSGMEGQLKMLDANHNGMIDEDEVKAIPSGMVQGMMKRYGFEKYPIAINDIKQAMEKSLRERAARSASDGPPGGGRGDSFGRSSSDPPKSPSSVSASMPSAPTPATPTVGSTPTAPAAPGAPSTPATAAAPAKPDAPAGTAAGGEVKKPTSKSGRFLTPQERLTGLPEWFKKKDADGDGQVTMAEFARDWTPELLNEFNRYDLNHDGVITAAECLRAEKRSNQPAK